MTSSANMTMAASIVIAFAVMIVIVSGTKIARFAYSQYISYVLQTTCMSYLSIYFAYFNSNTVHALIITCANAVMLLALTLFASSFQGSIKLKTKLLYVSVVAVVEALLILVFLELVGYEDYEQFLIWNSMLVPLGLGVYMIFEVDQIVKEMKCRLKKNETILASCIICPDIVFALAYICSCCDNSDSTANSRNAAVILAVSH